MGRKKSVAQAGERVRSGLMVWRRGSDSENVFRVISDSVWDIHLDSAVGVVKFTKDSGEALPRPPQKTRICLGCCKALPLRLPWGHEQSLPSLSFLVRATRNTSIMIICCGSSAEGTLGSKSETERETDVSSFSVRY